MSPSTARPLAGSTGWAGIIRGMSEAQNSATSAAAMCEARPTVAARRGPA